MTNKKKNIDINADRFDELLAISGYTYPKTDKELDQFEALYEDYDFELKNIRINPEEIINNTFRKQGKVINFQNEEVNQDISEIRLAARKGSEEIPQSIIEKMKSKHSNGNK